MLTDVFLGASEVVGEGAAAHLVGAEETEVPGHLSGDGGGQTPEETLRALQSPDGPHHWPDRTEGGGDQEIDKRH